MTHPANGRPPAEASPSPFPVLEDIERRLVDWLYKNNEDLDEKVRSHASDERTSPRGARSAEGFAGPVVCRVVEVKQGGLDFSFSGLKTHTLTTVRAHEVNGQVSDRDKADIARAFEGAVVDTLVIKCRRALKQENLTRLVMAGGVSANLRLRAALEEKLGKDRCEVFYPAPKLCTDNGAMIAYAGALRLAAGECDGPEAEVRPRWPMTELNAPRAG